MYAKPLVHGKVACMNKIGSHPPRSRSALWKMAATLLLCIAFVSLGYLGALMSVGEESWGLDKIESYLKVSIPKDSQDFNYTSGTNRNFHIELSFKASPNSALSFTSHFCAGVLHQGYDPFNAIYVDE
jgi:hypothetical protein